MRKVYQFDDHVIGCADVNRAERRGAPGLIDEVAQLLLGHPLGLRFELLHRGIEIEAQRFLAEQLDELRAPRVGRKLGQIDELGEPAAQLRIERACIGGLGDDEERLLLLGQAIDRHREMGDRSRITVGRDLDRRRSRGAASRAWASAASRSSIEAGTSGRPVWSAMFLIVVARAAGEGPATRIARGTVMPCDSIVATCANMAASIRLRLITGSGSSTSTSASDSSSIAGVSSTIVAASAPTERGRREVDHRAETRGDSLIELVACFRAGNDPGTDVALESFPLGPQRLHDFFAHRFVCSRAGRREKPIRFIDEDDGACTLGRGKNASYRRGALTDIPDLDLRKRKLEQRRSRRARDRLHHIGEIDAIAADQKEPTLDSGIIEPEQNDLANQLVAHRQPAGSAP